MILAIIAWACILAGEATGMFMAGMMLIAETDMRGSMRSQVTWGLLFLVCVIGFVLTWLGFPVSLPVPQ